MRRSQILCFFVSTVILPLFAAEDHLTLNDQEYFEMPGLNVMVFHDYYPEGHQGGITLIQHGSRVAANGDIRLEPAPGQWQPIPKVGKRDIDQTAQSVSVSGEFPDPERDKKGFNPIVYPDLQLDYTITVKAEGKSFRIVVDLDNPLPPEWQGKVGFNLELFPGELFGQSYILDESTGLFPRQLNGPLTTESDDQYEIMPMAEGRQLTIAPENAERRLHIESLRGPLQLLDGRTHHNNGWFVARSPILDSSTQNAVEWLVTPHVQDNWHYRPVIHTSQVGYHPAQKKIAVFECDLRHTSPQTATLKQILPSGELQSIVAARPQKWGRFLRYLYYQFDFSKVREAGLYIVEYDGSSSEPFQINPEIYDRHVWQPTLEYFLPVQMCHMRINDRYRVWHGLCHMDDARMAPINHNHFDGYKQGHSTLTSFQPGETVPGLNVGGWHDAGDYDLRVESQASTVRILALAYECFAVDYDQTTIDQSRHLVEMFRPDGFPDILQQIEHGVLSILAGYRNLGRLYRGIICPQLRQYVMLGDAASMTDNLPGGEDDRWVFTEENPRREIQVAACLAAASRVLKDIKPDLARECLEVAERLWNLHLPTEKQNRGKLDALTELILTTGKPEYVTELISQTATIEKNFGRVGWSVGRLLPMIDNPDFEQALDNMAAKHEADLLNRLEENPFGVPYRPNIWGAGWTIQRFGFQHYFLHKAWPNLISNDHFLNALNFVLGCHPGKNTKSFASGIGTNSLIVAYGVNRADWSYIPGGVASGTAYIRPDLPELKTWPFFWQQSEYVMGGGASHFMFLVLAAQNCLTH